MWALIFGAVLVGSAAGFVYLVSRFYKFTFMKKITMEKKFLNILLSILIILIMFVVLTLTINMMNAIIVLMHLVVIWLIFDLIFFIIKKCRKKPFKFYYQGVVAIAATVAYLTVGWYFAHNVVATNYDLTTDKDVESLRIVQISDSHIGATFHYKEFSNYVDKMNKENPDVVVITGDFVDDDTSKEDMINSCKALSKFKTKYGVYFVYGNHDKGYYGKEYRGYDGNDLANELKKNGVKVLEDESVQIGDKYYLVGRQDYSEVEKGGTRKSAGDLVKNLDSSKYIIMLDHQPNHYDEEKNANVDLVLSGHTHGGQLIPITYSGEWLGMNDKTYGYEKENNTDFIVSSGIGDWSIKFKTGCKAEYVVVNINK